MANNSLCQILPIFMSQTLSTGLTGLLKLSGKYCALHSYLVHPVIVSKLLIVQKNN